MEARRMALNFKEEAAPHPREPTRRSHLEIRMDILKAVQVAPVGPTQIMYKANLSWLVLQENLTTMLEKGFLRKAECGNRRKYELTEKGLNLLRSYSGILREILPTVTDEGSSFL